MILFYHFAINIGMNIGFAPVIGIPLPFFSYGGSSMMSFSMMMFILLKLDSQRRDVLQ
jgi:rod shape determining protein RodA